MLLCRNVGKRADGRLQNLPIFPVEGGMRQETYRSKWNLNTVLGTIYLRSKDVGPGGDSYLRERMPSTLTSVTRLADSCIVSENISLPFLATRSFLHCTGERR